MWPWKIFPKHPSFSSLLFPNLNGQKLKLEPDPIKLSSQSETGKVNKYDLTVFIRLFQGCSKPMKALHLFRVIAIFQRIRWFDSCTSSKNSSAGWHTERRWRCSKCSQTSRHTHYIDIQPSDHVNLSRLIRGIYALCCSYALTLFAVWTISMWCLMNIPSVERSAS
jgi:hypothetical protein